MPFGSADRLPNEVSVGKGAVNLFGAEALRARLAGIAARLNPEALIGAEFIVMEAAEDELFARLEPHFVQSSRTRTSLTDSSSSDAIREIHGMEGRFGTKVWYAKWLRQIDGPSGKPRGRKRVGPNLVLGITQADQRKALTVLGEFLMRGT
jgi:hypothetical protein